MAIIRFLIAAFVCCASFVDTQAAPGRQATLSVDWRGLPNVEGVLRQDSKSHYGFVNFIAFGPGWAYTAQDYAAKNHKKEAITDAKYGKGLLFTGKIWAGRSGLDIREEFYDVSKDGEAQMLVRWTISSQKKDAMNLERVYLRFPLAINDFADGHVGDVVLPAEYGSEWIGVDSKKPIKVVSKDGKKSLSIDIKKGRAVIQDARKDRQQRYELRLEFENAKSAPSSTLEFICSGSIADGGKAGRVNLNLPPPPTELKADDDWCVFPYENKIQEGSILDWSYMNNDAPAGKYGFVRVSPDGHFTFEKKPSARVRFIGGNLCFDANFISKAQVDQQVRHWRQMGWNTMRLHHIDVTFTKSEWANLWQRRDMPELNPKRFEQIDYLMAECKKAGIYLTFDLYAMGCLGSCEGFDKPLNSNTIKAIVPLHKPAEDQWFKRTMELFNHVNPHTGVAWKDEPQIIFVTLMNEDSIASVWWGAADMYVKKYNEWAKKKGYPQYDKKGINEKKEFAEFLYEVKTNANRRMGDRLKAAGVKALISGGNWWDNMAQTYERDALEVVDNHQYGDHPQPSYQKIPFHINQTSSVKVGNATYSTPIMMAPTRVLGKPFTVTEYNYCTPNRFRAEGGLLMGAFSSLQDWDGLYRFAWSHSASYLDGKTHRVSGFDAVTDPITQMAERQVMLLFGRRDVKPAEKTLAYAVTREESMKKGLGDMWAKGLFPHKFTQMALTSRIGSFVADTKKAPAVAVDRVITPANVKELVPQQDGRSVSDTKEIEMDTRLGHLAVNTPKTAGVTAVDMANLTAGPLSVAKATTFYSISASSMDKANLVNSKRILIFHLTEVANTGMRFSNDKRTDLSKWGELPYLAKTGSAIVKLENANPNLKLWALASDGSRMRAVKTIYKNGAYFFKVAVEKGEGENAPTMMYELSAK